MGPSNGLRSDNRRVTTGLALAKALACCGGMGGSADKLSSEISSIYSMTLLALLLALSSGMVVESIVVASAGLSFSSFWGGEGGEGADGGIGADGGDGGAFFFIGFPCFGFAFLGLGCGSGEGGEGGKGGDGGDDDGGGAFVFLVALPFSVVAFGLVFLLGFFAFLVA